MKQEAKQSRAEEDYSVNQHKNTKKPLETAFCLVKPVNGFLRICIPQSSRGSEE